MCDRTAKVLNGGIWRDFLIKYRGDEYFYRLQTPV